LLPPSYLWQHGIQIFLTNKCRDEPHQHYTATSKTEPAGQNCMMARSRLRSFFCEPRLGIGPTAMSPEPAKSGRNTGKAGDDQF
jgi:hypothetical protein